MEPEGRRPGPADCGRFNRSGFEVNFENLERRMPVNTRSFLSSSSNFFNNRNAMMNQTQPYISNYFVCTAREPCPSRW
jgi:hypothetical protein